jgi:hypothetical protein
MTHDSQAIGLLCHQYPIPYQQHHGKIANGQKGLLAKQNVGWFWRRSEIHPSIHPALLLHGSLLPIRSFHDDDVPVVPMQITKQTNNYYDLINVESCIPSIPSIFKQL